VFDCYKNVTRRIIHSILNSKAELSTLDWTLFEKTDFSNFKRFCICYGPLKRLLLTVEKAIVNDLHNIILALGEIKAVFLKR
jgi:hypothetical protein